MTVTGILGRFSLLPRDPDDRCANPTCGHARLFHHDPTGCSAWECGCLVFVKRAVRAA